jgi:hypothetical protein
MVTGTNCEIMLAELSHPSGEQRIHGKVKTSNGEVVVRTSAQTAQAHGRTQQEMQSDWRIMPKRKKRKRATKNL